MVQQQEQEQEHDDGGIEAAAQNLLEQRIQREFGLVGPWPGHPRVLELHLGRVGGQVGPGETAYELRIERVGDEDGGRDVGHPLRNRPEALRDGGMMPNSAVAWVMLGALMGSPDKVESVLGLPRGSLHGDLPQRRLCNSRLLQSLASLLRPPAYPEVHQRGAAGD